MGQTENLANVSSIPSTVIDLESVCEEVERLQMEVDNQSPNYESPRSSFRVPHIPSQIGNKFRHCSTLPGGLSYAHCPSNTLSSKRVSRKTNRTAQSGVKNNSCESESFLNLDTKTDSERVTVSNNPETSHQNTATSSQPSPSTSFSKLEVTSSSRAVAELQTAVRSGDETEVRRVTSQEGLQLYSRLTRSSPLHLAASQALCHLFHILISAGCSIASYDSEGDTPLHTSCRNADTQTTSALLEASKRIDPNVTNKALNVRNYAGVTPFLLAASTGNASLMTSLARAGCDVNSGDGLSGRTALHHAAKAGNIPLVRFLLQTLKADVNRRDFGGNTALGLVDQYRRQELALLLIRQGGEVRV